MKMGLLRLKIVLAIISLQKGKKLPCEASALDTISDATIGRCSSSCAHSKSLTRTEGLQLHYRKENEF